MIIFIVLVGILFCGTGNIALDIWHDELEPFKLKEKKKLRIFARCLVFIFNPIFLAIMLILAVLALLMIVITEFVKTVKKVFQKTPKYLRRKFVDP